MCKSQLHKILNENLLEGDWAIQTKVGVLS